MAMSPRLLRPRASGPSAGIQDANDWRDRVVANGGTVSASTLNAVRAFCVSIQQQGLRDRFYRLNLFCGTSDASLNSVRTPLYRGQSRTGTQYGNITDTNVNFVEADYAETGAAGGITASGVGRYLDTGSAPTGWPTVDTGHMSYWRRAGTTTGSFTHIPIGSQSGVAYRMDERSSGQFGFWGSFTAASAGTANAEGQRIVSRTGPTSLTLYSNGVSVATNSTSATPTTHAFGVRIFDANFNGSPAGSYFIGTLRAYSFGASMTAAQASAYYAAMNTFMVALSRV